MHTRRQSDKSGPARVVFLLEELNLGVPGIRALGLVSALDQKLHSDLWLLRSGTVWLPWPKLGESGGPAG